MNKKELIGSSNNNDKLYIIYVRGPFVNDDLYLSLCDYQPEELQENENDSNAVMIYGYTIEKKVLKKFKKTRKMDRFFIVEKDISMWTANDLHEFQKKYIPFDLMIIPLSTASYKVGERTESGISEVFLPITTFERTFIDSQIEYYDEWIIASFTETDVKMMSLIIKMAKPKFLKLLIESGLVQMLGYVEFLVMGDTDIEFNVGLDEVYVLLDYFGELFEF